MSEQFSSVEASESFKMSVQLRAQVKLDNFGERYEQKAEKWIKRAEGANLETGPKMTPEHIAMAESAREILVEKLYGKTIHLEEGRFFDPIRVGGSPIEGPSKEGVLDVAEKTFEQMNIEGDLFVINKLNEDYTPANNYEALVLMRDL